MLSILHLLDKPDEAWDDPGMDRIYDELRAEFDLVDRYQALELKLRSVQEALELVLDVARDRRLVLLEAAIVLLIVLRDRAVIDCDYIRVFADFGRRHRGRVIRIFPDQFSPACGHY